MILEITSISLYADDKAFYTAAKMENELMLNFRMELTSVCEWLEAYILALKAEKISMQSSGLDLAHVKSRGLNIKIGYNKTEKVSLIKYLSYLRLKI